MEWVVVVSVLVMTLLSLLRVNVIIAIIIAAITAGLLAGLSLTESVGMLVGGMGGQAETALSYILLGAFAVAISYTGITTLLVNYLIKKLTGKKTMMMLAIAGVASLSQNVIPVHIAFIPILIPPLLKLFDDMKLDRRGVASALTFGLKAPYIMIPAGFGLIFHKTIKESMESNGLSISLDQITLSMLIPGIGMIVGLLIAVFITYRKDRVSKPGAGGGEVEEVSTAAPKDVTFNRKHFLTLIAIVAAVVVQLTVGNLILGALTGLVLMFLFIVVPFHKGDKVMTDGIAMMGTISFVMLVSSGFANILQKTGAVDVLVEVSSGVFGENN